MACSHSNASFETFDPAIQPMQTIEGAEMIFSDSGILQMKLWGKEMQTFNGSEKTQIFPKGVKVIFYENGRKISGEVTADYAKNFTDKKLLQATGHVVIKNFEKNETTYTEELFWNQEKRTIYSNKYVKQVSPTGTMEGTGFDSDDQMESFRLRNPRGVVTF